jgi:hypothetical protein
MRVADYDATGWLDVMCSAGTPADRTAQPLEGAHFSRDPAGDYRVYQTLLWLDGNGFLETIEILEMRADDRQQPDAIAEFLEADDDGLLRWGDA